MVTYDNASGVMYDGPGSSASWSHTVGSGNNRILLIGIGCYFQGYTDYCISSVTVGSQSATRLTVRQANRVMHEVWYLLNPNSDAQTITVTMRNSAAFYGGCGSVSYSGVNQSTPPYNYNTQQSSTPSVQINLASENETVFQSLGIDYWNLGTGFTSWNSSQTARWNRNDSAASIQCVGCDKNESTSGNKTYSASLNGNDYWVYVAVELRNSAGASDLEVNNLTVDGNAIVSGDATIGGHNHFYNSSTLITRQQLIDHLYKVGLTPEEFDWNTIPQYIRFGNPTTGISAYLFCPSLSDGANEPVLYWNRALAVRKDIISGGRLDSMEGVVSLLGGVGWGPNGYDSNPFIWLVGNQYGYPAKDTLEIRISTYSGGWIWNWGKLASGDFTANGIITCSGNHCNLVDTTYNNRIGVQGVQDSNQGGFRMGNNGPWLYRDGGYLRTDSPFVTDSYLIAGQWANTTTYGPLYRDSSGRIGYNTSSLKYKENIRDLTDCSWIYELRPVMFDWKEKTREQNQVGLIAEEVNDVFPQLVSLDKDGNAESVHYEWLGIPLLVEIKKVHAEVADLRQQIKQLTANKGD